MSTLRRLFIESQDAALFSNCDNAHLYEYRCLPLARHEDICIFSKPLARSIIDYYNTLGGDLPTILIPTTGGKDLTDAVLKDTALQRHLRTVTSPNGWIIEPYGFHDSILTLASTLGLPINISPELCKRYTAKSGFKMLTEDLFLPTPPWVNIKLPDQHDVLLTFIKQHGQVILKRDNSINGIGTMLLNIRNISWLQAMHPGDYICEQYIEANIEGSFHIIVSDDSYRILIVETYYDSFQYIGCKFPARDDVYNAMRPIADRLVSYLFKYYRPKGYYGIDFLIDHSGIVYLLEMNPRKTAVTYALESVNRYFPEAILKREIRSRLVFKSELMKISFVEIVRRIDHYFNAPERRDYNVLLHNCGLLQDGGIEIIAITPYGEGITILNDAEKLLT